MDELVRWLGEQLDEDERIARAAAPGPWHANAESDEVLAVDGVTVADGFALSGRQLRATTEHIVRHNPARVLREIEAKRSIIKAFVAATTDVVGRAVGVDAQDGLIAGLTEVVQSIASVYADRPGYREEWRPKPQAPGV